MSSEAPAHGGLLPRGAGWPILIVGLLVGHILVVLAAVTFASMLIPGAAVAPAAYDAALRWDERRAQQQASDRLGWTLDCRVGAATPTGQRELELALLDATGAPLDGATIRLTCYHHARANEPFERVLPPSDSGVYTSVVPLRREGLWRLEAVATRGDDRFLVETDFWFNPQADP